MEINKKWGLIWRYLIISLVIIIFLILFILFNFNLNNAIAISLETSTNSTNSQIIDSSTEIYYLNNGDINGIFYSSDVFKFYNGKWYDLISFADISIINNVINISYLNNNNSLILEPYFVYLGNKTSYSILSQVIKDQINLKYNFTKKRNDFKFSSSFVNINGISEIGFDFSGNVKLAILNNKTILNDAILIDFNDLVKNNFTIFINESTLRITNLKSNINDLDPIVQFNSSSVDGHIRGPFNGTGNGDSCCIDNTSGTTKSGLLTFSGTTKEFRQFFSFNTSSLGENAQIKSANLSFYVSLINDLDNNEIDPQPCHFGSWNYVVRNGTFIDNSLDVTEYSKGAITTGLSSVDLGIVERYVLNLSDTGAINKTGFTDFVIKPLFASSGECNEWVEISNGKALSQDRPYLNITYTIPANENQGRDAIEQAISNTINNSIRHQDQQIYIVNGSNNHKTGKFDKVAILKNQTWAFNYVTSGENFTNITRLQDNFIIWENKSLTSDTIKTQVELLINGTKE